MKNKPTFDPKKVYAVDLSVSIGSIPKDVIAALLQDGRIGSHVVDTAFPHMFNNIRKRRNANSQYDLEYSVPSKSNITALTFYKLDSKTLTKSSGVNLVPSSQVGKGRGFDRNEAAARAALVKYYVITDIRTAPVVYIWSIPNATAIRLINSSAKGKLTVTNAAATRPSAAPVKIIL